MTEQLKPEFNIQRLYTKDVSFESPQSPQLFSEQWTPEVKMDVSSDAKKVKDDLFEVMLKVTVVVKHKESVAFLVEVVQAGLFILKNFDDTQRAQMLGSFCPNILYPYAREVVSSLSAHGGFPALYLSPINFDALYAQHLNRVKAKADAGDKEEIIV